VIDLVIQVLVLALVCWGLGFGFGLLGLTGSFYGLFLVILFLVHRFYGGLLEAVWNGQTLGKRGPWEFAWSRSRGSRSVPGRPHCGTCCAQQKARPQAAGRKGNLSRR
jgi:hypothetical protein